MEWQKYYTHPVQNKQAESYSPADSDQTGQYTTETKQKWDGSSDRINS